jgi:pimeloyl-ACP methyl ester carboxylesterase
MAPRCQGLLPSLWAQVAQADGVRLVSFDRAGYGGSDRHPGRRIADVVADTEAVADAFGAERFLVFGESSGGPYALGCAALLPARVIAAVSMSGPAPFNAEGLDFMAGMGQDNIDEYNAALAGELPLRTDLSGVLSGGGLVLGVRVGVEHDRYRNSSPGDHQGGASVGP